MTGRRPGPVPGPKEEDKGRPEARKGPPTTPSAHAVGRLGPKGTGHLPRPTRRGRRWVSMMDPGTGRKLAPSCRSHSFRPHFVPPSVIHPQSFASFFHRLFPAVSARVSLLSPHIRSLSLSVLLPTPFGLRSFHSLRDRVNEERERAT